MEFYLDDCADEDALVRALELSGHSVHTPRLERTLGNHDDAHMRYAAEHGFALITKNPGDFVALHEQYSRDGLGHHGVLLIYQYGERRKNMAAGEIAAAIDRLISSGIPIANAIHNLNHWR